MKKILILDFFLAIGVVFCVWDLVRTEEIIQIVDPYDAQYTVAKNRYKWVTPQLFKAVYDNSQDIPIQNPAFLMLALIQAESEGNPRAIGPRVRFYKHRARGLMQVMPFWVRRNEVQKLHDPIFNVQTGIKIFRKYYRGNVDTALKNYNSGPGSKFYNWPYINKIKGEYQKMNNMLSQVK